MGVRRLGSGRGTRRPDCDRHRCLERHRGSDRAGSSARRRRVAGGARRVERIDADLALPLDVTDEESAAAFVGRAAAELGLVDILFNNAGLALGRYPFWESTVEDEATVLHTNVDGVLRMTRLTLPHMPDDGHIVFMGSVAGRQAYPNGASYVAAKFGLRGFVYALRGGPARTPDPDHDGRRRSRRERVFARPLPRRRRGGEGRVRGRRPGHAGRDRRLRPLALTPPHVNVDEIVVKAIAQSSGAGSRREE